MANSTPIFAVASYSNIQSYIDQGILTYPSYVFCKDKNTMVFVDKNLQMQNIKGYEQVSIINTEELPKENIQGNTFYVCDGIGYLLMNDILVPVFKDLSEDIDYDQLKNLPIVNKYGDIASPVVICDLENGSYSIKGQYKIGGNLNTTYITSSNVMFLVDSDEENKYITKLDAKTICVYTVNLNSMEVVTDKYATESWVKAQGYTTKTYVDDAIQDLYNKIASEAITKLSQLENDMGFLTRDDLNEIGREEIADLF